METKKIRLTTFLLLLLPLCLAILGTGCKKENKIDYDTTSIVGKWKLIKEGSCVGYSNSMIEFTEDSVFKGYKGNVLTYTSKISIKKGVEYYSDTIFFEREETGYPYMYLTRKGNDTLKLDPPIFTLTQFCTTYKRIK